MISRSSAASSTLGAYVKNNTPSFFMTSSFNAVGGSLLFLILPQVRSGLYCSETPRTPCASKPSGPSNTSEVRSRALALHATF